MLRKVISKVKNKFGSLLAVTQSLIVRTQKSRWARVAVSGPPVWDERNKMIGSFIPPGSSVIDMGCGAQTLKKYLPNNCTYQPCDLIKSTPETIQCDFNAGLYPQLDRKYSFVVSSGVLEYVHDHIRYLKECTALGDTLIISYNLHQIGNSILERLSNHWINHFSKTSLEESFRQVGLGGECLNYATNGEVIYRLQAQAVPVFVHSKKSLYQRAQLTIGSPVLSVTGNEARLHAKITASDGIVDELWYLLPALYKDWFVTDQCDGFVVGLLHQCMERSLDIVTESPMSSKLWHKLTNFYIPMMAYAFPHLNVIKIIPKALTTTTKPARGVATGLSAGIDSFAAVLQHFVEETQPERRVTHFLFHNVGSHGYGGSIEDDRRLFLQRFDEVELFAREAGIPCIPVDSNLSRIYPIDFIKIHHALNASVLLVLQNQFNCYFYASTYQYEFCGVDKADDISRFDPIAFHMLSTETLDCVSTGSQISRIEKTRLVAKYEPSYRYLSVCVNYKFVGRNCSTCFKCCRTMLTLELLGLAHHYQEVFDFRKFNTMRAQFMLTILFHKPFSFEREIASLYLMKRRDPWAWALKLRRTLDRVRGDRWK